MTENMVFRNGKPLDPDEFDSIDESGRAAAMREHHRERAGRALNHRVNPEKINRRFHGRSWQTT